MSRAFAQRRPGDRDGVDDVRLGALARRRADAGHQLRRDAHDLLATLKQEPLKRAEDVAAILDRPHPLSVKAAGPDEQIVKRAALGLDRLVGDRLTGRGVDRGDGVRVLVGVRPNHDHLPLSLSLGIIDEPIVGGHISVGAMPRLYQVAPQILRRRRATQHPPVKPGWSTESQ